MTKKKATKNEEIAVTDAQTGEDVTDKAVSIEEEAVEEVVEEAAQPIPEPEVKSAPKVENISLDQFIRTKGVKQLDAWVAKKFFKKEGAMPLAKWEKLFESKKIPY